MNDKYYLERLLARFTINENECFEYNGTISDQGYGIMNIKSKNIRTHRLAWQLMVGPIPEGLCVLHHCDNRKCFNTEHLYLGNRADNMRDTIERDHFKSWHRDKTQCKRGHEFTEDNTYIRPNNVGRRCRTCQKVHQYNSYWKKKAAA